MAKKKSGRSVLESLLDGQESGSADLEEIAGIGVSTGMISGAGRIAPASAGKRILILEDSDNRYLPSLAICFGETGDDLSYRCVTSPAEVKKVLAERGTDLVVIDLCMEEMAGFDTLSFITRHYSAIPVVVMSAYSNPEVKESLESLGSLRLLNNPLDLDELPRTVIDTIAHPANDTVVADLSMVNMLRLIEMEKRSCVVNITLPSGGDGRMVFVEGELCQAVTGSLDGEDAAADILFWENAELAFTAFSGTGIKVKKDINKDVTALLDLFTLSND